MPVILLLLGLAIAGLYFVHDTQNDPKPMAERLLEADLMGTGENPQLDERIAIYREYLTYYPKNAGAWYELGHLLARKGDHTGAVAAYRTAHTLDRAYPLSGVDEDSTELVLRQADHALELSRLIRANEIKRTAR